MLQALLLHGFKSFADKTRLEFRSGVTVVVGPNGSGKSNVVDAIKWVLGSQSPKSLRGHEMVDVIFNGSGSRGPLQTAEASLVFDNRERRLQIDADEVHVTRRVYRSGEGEYLINRQVCRRRDIRDLLAVTGITTESYSIIEQGKVDVLLQSSPRDRRVLFEEAAGIRRFKVKKAEAARRLERVDQNMLRLADIVGEVETRLRTVRNQASVARKYREASQQLQQLRTQLGLQDWHQLSAELLANQRKIEEASAHIGAKEELANRADKELDTIEAALEILHKKQETIESQSRTLRNEAALAQGDVALGRERVSELTEEATNRRERLLSLSRQEREDRIDVNELIQRLESVSNELASHNDQLAVYEKQDEGFQRSVGDIRQQIEKEKAAHADVIQRLSDCLFEISQIESNLTAFNAHRDSYNEQLRSIRQRQTEVEANIDQHEGDVAHTRRQKDQTQEKIKQLRSQAAKGRQDLDHTRRKLSSFQAEKARINERIAVLEELEHRREGFSSAVKQVLDQVERHPSGPFQDVCGVVADLFNVDVDTAPLIEIALGDYAQTIILRSTDRLVHWLAERPQPWKGRVSFLALDSLPSTSRGSAIDLSGEKGIIGRADLYVETLPDYSPLVSHLLGNTWLVNNLRSAIALSRGVAQGVPLITGDGHYISAEGGLFFGPRLANTGLLSRASELRACRDQLLDIERQLTLGGQHEARHLQATSQTDDALTEIAPTYDSLAHQLGAQEHELVRLRRLVEELQRESELLSGQRDNLEKQIDDGLEQIAGLQKIQEEMQEAAAERERNCDHLAAILPQAIAEAEQAREAINSAKVAVAKVEQKRDLIAERLQQATNLANQRRQLAEQLRQEILEKEAAIRERELRILMSSQTLAISSLRLETDAAARLIMKRDGDQLRRERTSTQRKLRAARDQLVKLQQTSQKAQVEFEKALHQRTTLAERLQEDYGIDIALAAEEQPSIPLPQQRSEMDQQVDQLRQELAIIGPVNIEALNELDSLEDRFSTLNGQYQDLVEAKAKLEKVIRRINTDSRTLFLQTLDLVREHFQVLFRKLFGGGEADIILEDDTEDVLEAGIEIVACPPGKETRTISLLSGGERTLTCVALLLAVFRSRPSPFCILDEVDAALDEANIGRFTDVLKEFSDSTQFIVISHSKRTMVGADTLYGITMQESGISKLVSVRMEDVDEEGQVRTGYDPLPKAA